MLLGGNIEEIHAGIFGKQLQGVQTRAICIPGIFNKTVKQAHAESVLTKHQTAAVYLAARRCVVGKIQHLVCNTGILHGGKCTIHNKIARNCEIAKRNLAVGCQRLRQ